MARKRLSLNPIIVTILRRLLTEEQIRLEEDIASARRLGIEQPDIAGQLEFASTKKTIELNQIRTTLDALDAGETYE